MLSLSRTLGITAEEASILNVALGDIYADADSYIGATQGMTRNLRGHEDAMQAMGLKTRDAHGHLRSMGDLMQDSLSILSQYKEGIDRNEARLPELRLANGEDTASEIDIRDIQTEPFPWPETRGREEPDEGHMGQGP